MVRELVNDFSWNILNKEIFMELIKIICAVILPPFERFYAGWYRKTFLD